jgi:hypothetical protein
MVKNECILNENCNLKCFYNNPITNIYAKRDPH